MTASAVRRQTVAGPSGRLALTIHGPEDAPAVLMSHSILAAATMWERQASLLAGLGWRVVCADTRGHGTSDAPTAPYTMGALADDVIAILDELKLDRAHYVGLSLGGMTGFGLGIDHADRLHSLVLCDARADAPAAFAAPWPERMRIAREQGCDGLAASTAERWFGRAFLDANPAVEQHFLATIASTSTEGFIGCSEALLGLNYLDRVGSIAVPTTLIVGAKDGPLPDAMGDLQRRIAGSILEVIPDAGHLPNIDQANAFDAALLGHFERLGARP
jgi:3-oxoadipate enol-lactonase